MKSLTLFTVLALMLGATVDVATASPGTVHQVGIRQRDRDRICDCGFVDVNGDGICDNCGGCLPKGPDADGDGVPNGQDPDYQPPRDGSGRR